MKVTSSPVVGRTDASEDIAQIRAERQKLEQEISLDKEDPMAAEERRHKNAIAALPAIGSKSPLSNVGQGPKKGDPGTGAVAEFVPVSIKV